MIPLQTKGFTTIKSSAIRGACETCEEHNGAIYPVAERKEGENLPPFHPNCKCEVRGFSTKNPNHDPWLGETVFWLEIMYGDGTLEQKARKVIDFYQWTEFSVNHIANILTLIADIAHIGKRMEAFFARLEKPSAASTPAITPNDLKELGWHNATQEEANRLMEAFERFGITSRESMIQFMAIAMAESTGGLYSLEGEYMTEEAILRYLDDKDYDIYERGVGYIQVTYREAHLAFLEYISDDFRGENTASYISENYPLEISLWYWTIYGSPYTGGLNEFIETKTGEDGDSFLTFLKTAYYCAGMPLGNFNDDINDAIAGRADYQITDIHFIVNGRSYKLPNGWPERLAAYEKAQDMW